MDYTEEQRDAIYNAVIAARRAMSDLGGSATMFFDVFTKNNGLQVPGYPETNRDHIMAASSYVLRNLTGHPMKRVHKWPWLDDFIIMETNRAHSETYWFSCMQDQDAVAMELHINKDHGYYEDCIAILVQQDYGFGKNIYPFEGVLILPFCCSICTFCSIVYGDEIDEKRSLTASNPSDMFRLSASKHE